MPSDGLVNAKQEGRRGMRSPNERRWLGEKILDGRVQGKKLLVIADELGLYESTAKRYMDEALAARLIPTVDDFRKQANERLDATQRLIENNIAIADTLGQRGAERDDPNLVIEAVKLREHAAALQIRLDERRARLNGLDAPVVSEVTISTKDVADAELQAMIAEAQRLAAGGRDDGS